MLNNAKMQTILLLAIWNMRDQFLEHQERFLEFQFRFIRQLKITVVLCIESIYLSNHITIFWFEKTISNRIWNEQMFNLKIAMSLRYLFITLLSLFNMNIWKLEISQGEGPKCPHRFDQFSAGLQAVTKNTLGAHSKTQPSRNHNTWIGIHILN